MASSFGSLGKSKSVARVTREVSTRWFEAQFPGKCSACAEPFGKGASIGYTDAGLVTENCDYKDEPRLGVSDYRSSEVDGPEGLHADHLPAPPPRSVLCNSCFLYHGPGQTECW